MIVRIKAKPGGEDVRGYLPLRLRDDGVWVPIGHQAAARRKLAKQACLADICQQLDGLSEFVALRIDSIRESVARLSEPPTKDDDIRVWGDVYEVDAHRAITLQRSPPPQMWIDVNDPVCMELRKLMQLEDWSDEAAGQAILDHVVNEPLAIIATVARASPKLLGPVARLMAAVCRQLDFEPDWTIEPD